MLATAYLSKACGRERAGGHSSRAATRGDEYRRGLGARARESRDSDSREWKPIDSTPPYCRRPQVIWRPPSADLYLDGLHTYFSEALCRRVHILGPLTPAWQDGHLFPRQTFKHEFAVITKRVSRVGKKRTNLVLRQLACLCTGPVGVHTRKAERALRRVQSSGWPSGHPRGSPRPMAQRAK